MGLRRPKSNKNPPILSHEFVIQNHADIVSCVAMVFVIGLMFQATTPIASLFVTMQHNVTLNDSDSASPQSTLYMSGIRDLFTVFFYFLMCIVIHAVIQEYVLDKLNRRMHLSKTKHSKFNESGQLLVFYGVSAVWGIDLFLRQGILPSFNGLWDDYPSQHANMPFLLKFYFIIQIAYWLHCYPELYFQKIKKDEMNSRITYATIYLIMITAAYSLNFGRITLFLLVFHYAVEFIFHLSLLLYFSEKTDIALKGLLLWDVLFVIVRLVTIILSVLTFWYGLQKSNVDSIDRKTGNYNTQIVRINCLAAICLLQAYLMWNFINFHLKRLREKRQETASASQSNKQKKKKSGKSVDHADSDGADQNSPKSQNGSARHRSTPKSKKYH